ncbi:MAG: hypothetical protein ACFWT3_11790 [Pseudomonas lundensis]
MPRARYALTAERFSGERARELGLLSESYPAAELDQQVARWIDTLLLNSPFAMRACKDLLREVSHGAPTPAIRRYCENAIARIRVSPEGQEGLRAFLQKRGAQLADRLNATGAAPMKAQTLTTVLVANRGEIACRVMRTAKALGLTSVAVHSDTDRDARHCREADQCVNLGGSKAADSYLQIDKIIAAAKASGAQAIHPGYGFLSENAGFARAIEQAGLIFLGPPASAIDAMGSKSAAKALMEVAGVPLVPGYHGEAQDLQTFRAAAENIGYPVLLKATAGGGGKGMKGGGRRKPTGRSTGFGSA